MGDSKLRQRTDTNSPVQTRAAPAADGASQDPLAPHQLSDPLTDPLADGGTAKAGGSDAAADGGHASPGPGEGGGAVMLEALGGPTASSALDGAGSGTLPDRDAVWGGKRAAVQRDEAPSASVAAAIQMLAASNGPGGDTQAAGQPAGPVQREQHAAFRDSVSRLSGGDDSAVGRAISEVRR